MKDEVRVIGIIPERDIDGRITIKDLKKIVFEALQLGPMYVPLMDLLKKNDKISNDFLEIKDVFQTLNSTAFLKITPLVNNHHHLCFILIYT